MLMEGCHLFSFSGGGAAPIALLGCTTKVSATVVEELA
jgi:hypothetical protein